MTVLSEIKIEELIKLPMGEHAGLIAKVCAEVEPIMRQFEARVSLEAPDNEELLRGADYAKFAPRRLKQEIETAYPKNVEI